MPKICLMHITKQWNGSITTANMISKKTVRQKLVSYFEYLAEKTGSHSFETELSLSQLANYLCVDRTSLMRELRLMREEGLISSSGRKIQLLTI